MIERPDARDLPHSTLARHPSTRPNITAGTTRGMASLERSMNIHKKGRPMKGATPRGRTFRSEGGDAKREVWDPITRTRALFSLMRCHHGQQSNEGGVLLSWESNPTCSGTFSRLTRESVRWHGNASTLECLPEGR
jgi:hypothetical protein